MDVVLVMGGGGSFFVSLFIFNSVQILVHPSYEEDYQWGDIPLTPMGASAPEYRTCTLEVGTQRFCTLYRVLLHD